MHAAHDVEKFLKTNYILRQNSGQAPIAASFFSVIRIIDVDFTLPDGDCVPLKCVGNHSVSQIKNTLLEKMSELQKNCERFYENGFILTYVLNDKVFEIGDMDQTFQTLKIVNIWMTSKCRGKLDVKEVHVNTDAEQLANVRFGALMGVIWSKYERFKAQTTVNDEVNLTRRKLTNVRRKALEQRCLSKYTMEAVIDDVPLPTHVSTNIKEDKFNIKVTLEKQSETLVVEVGEFPKDILAKRLQNQETEHSENYTLKIFGKGEYIWGDHSIINFSYIRKCITRRKTPHLVVCEQPEANHDLPRRECDPWNYVDESTGVTQNHQQLTISGSNKNHTEVVAFSLWDLKQKFRLKMIGVDYLTIGGHDLNEKPDEVYVEISLYQGTQPLTSSASTKHISFSDDLRWDEWLELNIIMRNIPKEAKLNINIVGVYRTSLGRMKNKVKTIKGKEQDVILSWANKQIFDHRSTLCTGDCVMRTWPMIHNEDISFETYNGTTESNTDSETSKAAAEVHFQLDAYMHPVVFPNGGWEIEDEELELVSGSATWKKVIEIVQSNSMYQLDEDSKKIVRKYSNTFKSKPDSLPKLLQVVDFSDVNEVVWIHRLLKDWPDVSFEVALELLDERYVDEKVRNLAVKQLDRLSNQKLLVYMLQLTQALKFEPYHDSPLARFLITRALQSKRIGHYFFWYLRSEIENAHVSRRYSILLEAYLRGCGAKMLEEFSKQTTAINYLKQFSSKMNMKQSKQATTNATKVNDNLREEIAKLPLPKTFQAPYDPRIILGRLLVDKSKIMDSKKKPIWLEFDNGSVDESDESNESIKIIFKQGDDLRQDMLTLQMLTLMEQLWDQEGLDLCLLPYGCMSTGWQMGVIQIVPNATTVAKIQKEGAGLIRGAFKDEVLIKWLERKNPDKERLNEAIETFMRSCAGYCVATYVLGIGDRHNDNIMVTESGNLFHIDFGHFLGNTKKFYGIQRERVPFVLTPDFVYVMGGEESEMFEHFKETCIRAYIIIRRNATLFLNLFHMMRSTGIPELNSVKDIDYLQKVLLLDTEENEARKAFLSEIVGVLRKSWTVQLNWMMHGFAHSTNNS